jgi:DNA-binding XRE family transcriptional regulator
MGIEVENNTSQSQVAPAAAQAIVSRAQVAATTRAFQDIDTQIENARAALASSMTDAASMGPQAFQQAWKSRSKLNEYREQANTLQAGLAQHMPVPEAFQANLSDVERTQIQGLYASGLYTQQQLASQYGVKQPTINRVVSAQNRS